MIKIILYYQIYKFHRFLGGGATFLYKELLPNYMLYSLMGKVRQQLAVVYTNVHTDSDLLYRIAL